MIPIFEQGHGRGVGMMLDDFLSRMGEICNEHLKTGRARAIAVILRDAHDIDLMHILQDQGAYTKLDRLSGDRLSVFFVHTASDAALAQFNKAVGARLGMADCSLPAVVFFRTAKGDGDEIGFTDIQIQALDNADIIHGLQELYALIEQYVSETPAEGTASSSNRAKTAGKFISLELFRAALREGLVLLF